MGRVQEFEKWEESQKNLGNFILTKAKPHIYWLPKKMTDKATEKLISSRKFHESKCTILLCNTHMLSYFCLLSPSIEKFLEICILSHNLGVPPFFHWFWVKELVIMVSWLVLFRIPLFFKKLYSIEVYVSRCELPWVFRFFARKTWNASGAGYWQVKQTFNMCQHSTTDYKRFGYGPNYANGFWALK